jgi:hypothetical protein
MDINMGMLQAIKVPAYPVPGCNVCLLSTSSLLQTYSAETMSLKKGKHTLSGKPRQLAHGPMIAFVDPINNVLTYQAYSYYGSTDTPVQALQTIMTEVSGANLNIPEPEKKSLLWHKKTVWDALDTGRFNN